MGFYLSKLAEVFQSFSQSDPAKIIMLGLDAAGKTTILYKVKLNEVSVSSIPTIGFNVETVQPVKGVSFTVWDVGGQAKIRQMWKHYLQHSEGLIFVVDSLDRSRLQEAKEELFGILEQSEMRGVPVVVVANKQDLQGALSPYDLTSALSLRELSGRKWHIQGACAVTGEGIYESMEHMATLVKDFKQNGRRN